MLSLFKRKDKTNINDNQNEKLKFLTNKNKSTHASILNYFGFNEAMFSNLCNLQK
ncbi:hypothetical protein [Spiroplasma endosymbiont of Amphimallon solstitiale]|uniref:hypothetical protein n=1 Tax=Spiroplasma endosymbiont of Amphimallon solstitiale TaxID=3066288 RepID=UPI00313BB8CD